MSESRYYEELPLFLKLNDLLRHLYKIARQMRREHKFSLGADIIARNWELLDLFVYAQAHCRNREERKATIRRISWKFDTLRLRLRMLSDLKLVSLKQTARINKQVAEIGRMIGSWIKKTQ